MNSINPQGGRLNENGDLGFAMARLAAQTPPNGDYLQFLKENEPAVRGLIELRNGQEYADEASRTVIENVQLAPSGFDPPTWRRLRGRHHQFYRAWPRPYPFPVDFFESNFFFWPA